MDGTDRAADQALTSLFARITSSQVDPEWLAGELLAASIINRGAEEFASNQIHSRSQRLRSLIVDVKGNGRRGVFQDLVKILLANDTYSWLGEELIEAYTQAGGQWTDSRPGGGIQERASAPKLKELVSLVLTTRPYALGLELNIDEHILNVIETDHRNDIGTQLRKVLSEYLKRTPDASWRQVVTALHRVGEEAIADSIAQKFGIAVDTRSD